MFMASLLGIRHIWDRGKPHDYPLPHHRTNGLRIRRFGRLGQLAPRTACASQPELHYPPHPLRFHPSRRTHAPRTRRMHYCCSLTGDFSSLSIPFRGTVRAFSLWLCGSAYLLLRLSAWSASIAFLPASDLLCPLQTPPRYSAPIARRPASISEAPERPPGVRHVTFIA